MIFSPIGKKTGFSNGTQQKIVPIHKKGSWLFFWGGIEAFEKGDPLGGLVRVFLKNGGSFLKLQSHEMNKYMRMNTDILWY